MIRLYRVFLQGEEKVINLSGLGRAFAKAALMGGHALVFAAARSATRLIAVDAAHFWGWLAEDTERCFRLMAAMSARMHKLLNDIVQLTLMKATDRPWQYLLDHADADEEGRWVVKLEAPKRVIASRLGLKPETFSRLLHRLTKQGCVKVQENQSTSIPSACSKARSYAGRRSDVSASSLQDERSGHPAALRCQDVVGSASGLTVHHL